MPGWDNYPLKSILQDYFQVPVVIENDANAARLGRVHNLRPKKAVLTSIFNCKYSIGGGIIINGQLLRVLPVLLAK